MDESARLKGLSWKELRRLAEARRMIDELQEVNHCLHGKGDIPGPLYWLQEHTETFDEKWLASGLEPHRKFPRLPYLPWLFSHLVADRRVFIPKSREMLASWSVVGYAVWKCQFHPRQRVLIQGQKIDKVVELIKGKGNPGYARTLIERQSPWLLKRFPLLMDISDQSQSMISWKNGSTLQGVPAGPDQVRQYHPSVLIVDEAAFIDDFEQSYAAADPVAEQIIAVSSAAAGFFGDICTQALEHSGFGGGLG